MVKDIYFDRKFKGKKNSYGGLYTDDRYPEVTFIYGELPASVERYTPQMLSHETVHDVLYRHGLDSKNKLDKLGNEVSDFSYAGIPSYDLIVKRIQREKRRRNRL